MTIREAWTRHVQIDDYRLHMERIGQAEANAALVYDLMKMDPPTPGARILVAGAGPGQMFEFLPADTFAAYRLICTDVNEAFLTHLAQKVACDAVLDDIENSHLEPGFGMIIVVLVLEHVDWRKALRSLQSLAPERLLVVIQGNPPGMSSAVTPGRVPPGSMEVFASDARPQLVSETELVAEIGREPRFRLARGVADNKEMIGLLF